MQRPSRRRLDPSDPDVLPRIAGILKAMADPVRLRILVALREGERCVSDLVRITGGTQANVSKHLSVLRLGRLVTTRKDGPSVFYAMADAGLHDICDAVCRTLQGQIEREWRLARPRGYRAD